MSNKNKLLSAVDYCRAHRESVLLCVTFALCLICAIADRFWLHRSDEFLGSLIFVIIIFLIPLFIYLSLSQKAVTPEGVAEQLSIKKISHRLIFLPIIAAFLLISGTLLLDMLFFGIYDVTDGFTLYGNFTANGDGSLVSNIYLILTFAIIPAFFEEIVFRKLLTRAHAKKGIFSAMLISGIFYALTPFSLRLIPSFFFSGVIYCALYMITGSLLTSISAHILFNLYGLYLRTNVANFFVSSSDVYALVIIAIIVFLISAILFVGMISKLFVAYAKAGKTPPPVPTEKKGVAASVRSAFGIFKSPATLACVFIYAAYVIIFAFWG